YPEKVDIKELKNEYIQDFKIDTNFLNINDNNNDLLDEVFQDLTFNFKENVNINYNPVTSNKNGEIFSKKINNNNDDDEKYKEFHNSLKGLLKDDDGGDDGDSSDVNVEKKEYINEKEENVKNERNKKQNEEVQKKKDEMIKNNKNEINEINNDKNDNHTITNENSKEEIDSNNDSNNNNEWNIIDTENTNKIKSQNNSENNIPSNNQINESQYISKIEIIPETMYNTTEDKNKKEMEYQKNNLAYLSKNDNTIIPLTNNSSSSSINSISLNSETKLPKIRYPTDISIKEKENTLSSSLELNNNQNEDDELLNRYEEMKKKISYLSSHGYNDIINKYSLNSNNLNKNYKKSELEGSNISFMSHDEVNVLKDNISVIYSMDNSFVSTSTTPSFENNSFKSVHSMKNENREL
ncbi:hypothetical protein PIROE2DRAFT_17657, partial [Piromyces sp. E2]